MKISKGQILAPQNFAGMADISGAAVMFGVVGHLIASSANSQTGKALYEARLDPVTKTFRPMRRLLR